MYYTKTIITIIIVLITHTIILLDNYIINLTQTLDA